MKTIGLLKRIIYTVFLFSFLACNETPEKKEVPVELKNELTSLMNKSAEGWNKGDMEAYMDVYWKSDSLIFMGLQSITYGWQATLDRYKKSYPDAATRGTLSFNLKEFRSLGNDHILVIGDFLLEREEKDNLSGNFSLIWEKINEQWKIIIDHT